MVEGVHIGRGHAVMDPGGVLQGRRHGIVGAAAAVGHFRFPKFLVR